MLLMAGLRIRGLQLVSRFIRSALAIETQINSKSTHYANTLHFWHPT
jgi:hypothetical protein